MLYREYGNTGKKVSLLGFGGMRFANIDDHEECVRVMTTAAEGGVNYFDTAPGYFETKGETVFGKGFAELRRRGLPYYSATKTFASGHDIIHREIDAQLKRMDIPAIDFYHIWCITSLDNWRSRKQNGVLQTLRKLKEEGLIRHICVSSHLIKDEINELLMEWDAFEGVLFGYSAYNFQTRQAAFDAIRNNKLGAVVMNPLGGGVIPRNPEKFGFLRRSGESAVTAALRFLWDHQDITSTLVGFETVEQVQEALAAMEGYKPRTEAELEEVKSRVLSSFEGICTGCGYCGGCPQGIPIPMFMDAYNHKILQEGNSDQIGNRLRWHWSMERSVAGKCTACGQCEKACTQHLNIIERLKEIAAPSEKAPSEKAE
jgi:predicted aldo/keto reductase-like oxidoreductase